MILDKTIITIFMLYLKQLLKNNKLTKTGRINSSPVPSWMTYSTTVSFHNVPSDTMIGNHSANSRCTMTINYQTIHRDRRAFTMTCSTKEQW